MSINIGQYTIIRSPTATENSELEIQTPLGKIVKIHSDSELSKFVLEQTQVINKDSEYIEKFSEELRKGLSEQVKKIGETYMGVFPPPTQLVNEAYLKENSNDGDAWIAITAQITENAKITGSYRSIQNILPDLARQIAQHRQDPSWKNIWGTSLNFDGFTKVQIVESKLLAEVRELAGDAEEGHKEYAYHAGILHTFSYLLSNVKTPFGYKRDRWISDDVAIGMGLPKDVWSPYPNQGNFMANIAYFGGCVAFGKEQIMNRVSNLNMVSSELQNYNFSNLEITRITEKIPKESNDGKLVELEINVDLVKFPNKPDSENANSQLLVYSLKDPSQNEPQLITLFAVNDSFASGLKRQEIGNVKDIRISYNATLKGFDENNKQSGTREIQIRP